MSGEPTHAAGWAALIADVLGRPGRTSFFAALERPLRTDLQAAAEAALEDDERPDAE